MPLSSSAKKRQPEWAENELWGCFFLALLLLTVPLKLLTAASVAAGFHELCHPYVKHTTKKYFLQKQKSQTIKYTAMVWESGFFNY